MVTSSAYVGDEKDINLQNAKMYGSNRQKEEIVEFASNNVPLRFLL